MTRQTSIQLSEATEQQVEQLKDRGFGNFTQIVRIAVDRMHQKESAQIYIQDCMPMMADVVNGRQPRPVELPDGADVNHHVPTSNGDVFWPDVAPAWRKLNLGDVSDTCLVARRGREPREKFCRRVVMAVRELRALLGEPGPAVCCQSRVLVFNSDGTRIAVMVFPA